MNMDAMDFSMDALKRHVYSNDCYEGLNKVHITTINQEIINPEDTLNYIIHKYNFAEKLRQQNTPNSI